LDIVYANIAVIRLHLTSTNSSFRYRFWHVGAPLTLTVTQIMRANPLGKGTHIRRYSAVISNYRYISVWSGKCTAFPCRGVGML